MIKLEIKKLERELEEIMIECKEWEKKNKIINDITRGQIKNLKKYIKKLQKRS